MFVKFHIWIAQQIVLSSQGILNNYEHGNKVSVPGAQKQETTGKGKASARITMSNSAVIPHFLPTSVVPCPFPQLNIYYAASYQVSRLNTLKITTSQNQTVLENNITPAFWKACDLSEVLSFCVLSLSSTYSYSIASW